MNINTHRLLKHIHLPRTSIIDPADANTVISTLARSRHDSEVIRPRKVAHYSIAYLPRPRGTLIQFHSGKNTVSDFVFSSVASL